MLAPQPPFRSELCSRRCRRASIGIGQLSFLPANHFAIDEAGGSTNYGRDDQETNDRQEHGPSARRSTERIGMQSEDVIGIVPRLSAKRSCAASDVGGVGE